MPHNPAYSVTIPYIRVYKNRSLDIIIKNKIQMVSGLDSVLQRKILPVVARRKISQVVSIYLNLTKM